MVKKRAILLRGYHYRKDHVTNSGFYKNAGKYDLDYERYFLKSFKENILNDSNYESDIYILTHDSEKLTKLINDLNPVKYVVDDLTKKRQDQTFTQGLEVVYNHCKENNLKYDSLLVCRMDQRFNKNPLDFFNLDKKRVNIFAFHNTPKNYYIDYIHHIPFKYLKKYIALLNATLSERFSAFHEMWNTNPGIGDNVNKIYNITILSKEDSEIIETDREFVCCAYTEHDSIRSINWEK